MNFEITEMWMSGFVEAAGSFVIDFVEIDKKVIPRFSFYISHKDKEPLIECQKLLQSRLNKCDDLKQTLIPKLEYYSYNVYNIQITQFDLLTKVVEPLFKDFPLLGSKQKSYALFFKALEVYNYKPFFLGLKLLLIANIMYAMNTKDKQRQETLVDIKKKIKPMFTSSFQWEISCEQEDYLVQTIINQNPVSLSKIPIDWFLGLIVGDGCLHSDFDCRKNRKITVRKALSVNLLKTQLNELLLNRIAEIYNFKWSVKRRHQVQVNKKKTIDTVFQPLFLENIKRFPFLTKKALTAWLNIDKLNILLKQPKSKKRAKEVKKLIIQIYEVHNRVYRDYSLKDILFRYKQDWNL